MRCIRCESSTEVTDVNGVSQLKFLLHYVTRRSTWLFLPHVLFSALPKPMTLYEICRVAIRRILRRNIQIEHPTATTATVAKRRSQSRRGGRTEKRRRINLVPMQAGLMIVGQFPTSDSDDDGDDDDDAEHDNANNEDGSRRSPTNGFRVFDEDDDGRTTSDDETTGGRSNGAVGRMLDSDNFLRRLFWPVRGIAEAQNALAEELGLAMNDDSGRDDEHETLIENEAAHTDEAVPADDEFEAAEDGDADAHEEPSQATSEAIVIDKSDIHSCKGYSGFGGGYSTSYSSGIGTCSSVGAESESGNVDGADDFFRPGTSAPHDGVFDDDSLDFDKSVPLPTNGGAAARVTNRSRSACEDHTVKMEDIAEVQEDAAAGGAVGEPFDASEDGGGGVASNGISFKCLMHEKVNMLPIPCALKDYLLYYRQL